MKTVLYVEDNAVNVMLVEAIFAPRTDVRLLCAMLGRTGLDYARQHRPDLILLDMHLPDMHGESFLQALRADPATASLPVVIVSADAMHEPRCHLEALGICEYVTKPFDLAAFERLIDRYIGPNAPQ